MPVGACVVLRAPVLDARPEQRPVRARLRPRTACPRCRRSRRVMPPISRWNCMCVWPQTTVSASTPANERRDTLLGRSLDEDVDVVPRRWRDRRGHGRAPSTSSSTRSGRPWRNSICSAVSCSRTQLDHLRRRKPCLAGSSSRSALPRIQRTRSPSARSRSSVSPGTARRPHRRRTRIDGVVGNFRQHGLERGQVAVDVVERGDAHPSVSRDLEDTRRRSRAPAARARSAATAPCGRGGRSPFRDRPPRHEAAARARRPALRAPRRARRQARSTSCCAR